MRSKKVSRGLGYPLIIDPTEFPCSFPAWDRTCRVVLVALPWVVVAAVDPPAACRSRLRGGGSLLLCAGYDDYY